MHLLSIRKMQTLDTKQKHNY